MLALIEGVGVLFNVWTYRKQQEMQQEQMEIQKKYFEKMVRIQQGDAWHDDRETKKEILSMEDAAGLGGQKSYSF